MQRLVLVRELATEVLARGLDAEVINPTTFNLREPSLDDVFLSLTGHKTTIEDGEDEAETAKPRRGMGRGRKGDVTDGKDAA